MIDNLEKVRQMEKLKKIGKKLGKKLGKKFVSVVLVTYNEKENLSKLVPIIENIFRESDLKGEIIVVDDSSPDGTADMARSLNKKFHNVRLLLRPKKMGPGSASADGYKICRGEIVIGMDVDFSHDPHDIPKFIKKIDEGYDVVVSSRYVRGGRYEVKSFQTWKKSMASWGGNILIRFLSHVPIHDFTGSFRAIHRDVIRNVRTESRGNSFFMEFLVKAHRKGYRITEVPIIFRDRVVGTSKLKLGKQSANTLTDLVKYTRQK
jgi:dolichol-phosphate mannosyltransferase